MTLLDDAPTSEARTLTLTEGIPLACREGQRLLAAVAQLWAATASDAAAADGRLAIAHLGERLEIGVLPAILPLWRADLPRRLGDIVEPSTLHLCWAMGWRAWFLAWELIRPKGQSQSLPRLWMNRPSIVRVAPALLPELERRWGVVRRMVRRGLPAVDEDVLQADLHNETGAMLRTPPPSAATPRPIRGIKERQLLAAWTALPAYTWKRTDDEIAAQLDAATPAAAEAAGEDGTPQTPTAAETDMATLAALIGDDKAAAIFAVARDQAKSADQRQRDICTLDSRVVGWGGGRWALLLQVTEQAARKTDWWKNERQRLRGGD